MRPELPTALKYLRQSLNLSQEEVASQILVSRQMLMSWEAGKLFPTREHFALWKKVLIRELKRIQLQDDEMRVGNKIYKTKRYARDKKRKKLTKSLGES
jgi:transcriptional regulator with XRE-family HTH domain